MTRPRKLSWGSGLTMVMVGFLGVVAVMVAIALSQRVDLVADDYYERALRHDQRIASEVHARALGERLSVQQAGDELRVTFPPAMEPAGIAGLCVLYRPSDGSADRRIVLQPDSSGVQRIELRTMLRGLWKAQLSWQYRGEQYYFETPIMLE